MHLLERCPEPNTLHTRVRAFAGVFTKRSSGLLDRWITQVNNDWIAPLTTTPPDCSMTSMPSGPGQPSRTAAPALLRHLVLAMAALAVCAVTAAQARTTA